MQVTVAVGWPGATQGSIHLKAAMGNRQRGKTKNPHDFAVTINPGTMLARFVSAGGRQ